MKVLVSDPKQGNQTRKAKRRTTEAKIRKIRGAGLVDRVANQSDPPRLRGTWDFIANATVRGRCLADTDHLGRAHPGTNPKEIACHRQPEGFVESFHGRRRDECLNREQLWPLTEERFVIEDLQRDYNQLRPHGKLGYQSPETYAAQRDPFPSPVELRLPSDGNGRTNNQPPHYKTSPED